MRRVIFHLGTHKAASTRIQLLWARNREYLQEAGVCYPMAPQPTPIAHHSLAWNLRGKYGKPMRRPGNQSLEDVMAQFRASGADTLLLSSEDFLVTSFESGYPDSLFADLRDAFDEIVVCAYVRGRSDFFNSSYNQWVKSLSFDGDFDAYLKQHLHTGLPQIHYTRALEVWAQGADRAIYLPFDKSLFGDTPEMYLSRRIGLSREALETFSPVRDSAVNKSIDYFGATAFRLLKEQLETHGWYDYFAVGKRKRLLQYLFCEAQDQGWTREKFRPLEEGHYEVIREVFREEDDAFARRYFDGAWSDIFPQDLTGPSREQALSAVDPGKDPDVQCFVRRGVDKARAVYLGDNPLGGPLLRVRTPLD